MSVEIYVRGWNKQLVKTYDVFYYFYLFKSSFLRSFFYMSFI